MPAAQAYLARRATPAVLGGESVADLAQSVCGDALARLRRGELEYRSDAELKGWLFNAADLKLRSRYRRYTAVQRDRAREGTVGAVAGVGASPSQDAATLEQQLRVREALAGLDERTAEMVVAFHFDGASHRALAERYGVTESHSRTLVARGLARLGTVLVERDPTGG